MVATSDWLDGMEWCSPVRDYFHYGDSFGLTTAGAAADDDDDEIVDSSSLLCF